MSSSRRRKARELMVQALYAAEVGGSALAAAITDQVERRQPHPDSRRYVDALGEILSAHQEEFDGRIDAVLDARSPERVGAVERSILRLALAELSHRPDVPSAVVIDEALSLARIFSSDDSVRFVHGVLDRLLGELRPGEAGQ